jgi:Zn-dependent peptidase ImmA (M78 family)
MVLRVDVKPEMLRWAVARAGLDEGALTKRLPRLPDWLTGEARPTLKQLEALSRAVHVPIGYLFLPEPPVEPIPIPDFRTIAGTEIASPSPDLLDTLYLCQQRQAWYRDHARSVGEPARPFVGSVSVADDVVAVAEDMRKRLSFDLEARRASRTWTEALRAFIGQADEIGVLVMCSGVVGNDNHRKLDPREFRGFALVDDLAPVVFVNGADTKAAQMFTLAHELAHVWLGESALSDAGPLLSPDQGVERWCNEVAAELLVPLNVVRAELDRTADVGEEAKRLAKRFKVSSLVLLRRFHDAGGLSRDEYFNRYEDELNRILALPRSSGGQFYLTEAARVSRRFATALVVNALEGQTLHRDAMQMLGIRKIETLHGLARNLGIAV